MITAANDARVTDALPGRRRVQPLLARIRPAPASSSRPPTAGGRYDRAPRSCRRPFPRCFVRRLRLVWAMVNETLVGGSSLASSASSISRLLRTGRSCGKPVERVPRRQPDQLAPRPPWRASRSRRRRPRSRPPDGPRRSSRPARPRARRATGRSRGRRSSPSAPPSRMRAAIALASSTVAGGASSTLNATSGGRAADQHRAGGGVQPARSEVGTQLAGLDPLRQRRRATAPQLRPRPSRASSPYRKTGSSSSRRADRRARAPRRTRRRGRADRGTRSAPRRSRRRGGECRRGGARSIRRTASAAPFTNRLRQPRRVRRPA